LFRQSIFAAIAIVSIAASVSAEAKPRHHKQHRIAHATIVCNDRGCSDHRATAPARHATKAAARHKARHAHRNRAGIRSFAVRQSRRAHVGSAVIVCNQQGCSDRAGTARAEKAMASVDARHVIDANGNGIVVGGRPTGCPHAFCGCEASRYVFGEMRRELYLASNWIRKFPRAAPAPGMAAARSGHVMILISHVGGNDWLVHDGNSGGGKTRDHVMSISRYVIVDPRSSRSAQR
jgi:hypothetical protein